MSYIKNSILSDRLGNEVEIGLFGGLKVSNSNPQISHTFDHPLEPTHLTVSGDVTSQVNRSLLKVATGGSAETTNALRYKTAQTIETYFTAGFNGTFTSGTSIIGLFDVEAGVYLGYKDGAFIVGYRNIYADEVGNVPDTIQVVIPPVNVNTITRYRIRFGYLGVGDISYEYFANRQWHTLHIFETDNTLTDRTHIGRAILPMRCEVSHTGCFIYSGSWNAQTYGTDSGLQDEPFFSDGERDIAGDTAGLPLIAFRSATIYGNYPNKIRSRLLTAEFATGSEGLYKIEFYGFPAGTIAGTATWAAVDTDSVLEQSTDIVLADITGGLAAGKKVFSTNLAVPSSGTGVASATLDFDRLGVKAKPGEEFVIVKREIIGGSGDNITTWSIAFQDLH